MESLFVFAALGDIPFFKQIAYGAYIIVDIAKWAALLYAVIKLVGVGFSAMASKDNPEALGEAKDKGGAVLIGLAIVLLAFSIQQGLKGVLKEVHSGSDKATVEINNDHTNTDTFN